MSKEAYVSFETAKLFKEKEFDWKCNRYYLERASDNEPLLCPGSIMYGEDYNKRLQRDDLSVHINVSSGKISAPTQQMACRWLREVHNIFIGVDIGEDIDGEFGYMPFIHILDNLSCSDGKYVPHVDADDICDFTPHTYEDAVEAAIKYVLKNLI